RYSFFYALRTAPNSTFFPYTTLFRSKADMRIARQYAGLVGNERERTRLFSNIEAEFHRTVATVLEITAQRTMLERQPQLLASLRSEERRVGKEGGSRWLRWA